VRKTLDGRLFEGLSPNALSLNEHTLH